jgi:hypothetical protein
MRYRGAVAHGQGVCHRVLDELTAEPRLRQALREHEELTAHHGSHCRPPRWPRSCSCGTQQAEAASLLDRARRIADTHGMTTLTARYAGRT